MRGIDIFCASQAATAIRASTMDEASSSSITATAATIHLGRAIDRHNPIIRDPKRITKSLPPCSSQLPITPKPLNPTNHHHHHHAIKSTKNSIFKANNDNHQSSKKSSSKPPSDDDNKKKKKKGCAKPSEQSIILRKSCVNRPGDFISPPASTRYLLGDRTTFLDVLSDNFDPVLALVPVENNNRSQAHDHVKTEESSSSKPPSDQVVVLRVSLHCKGCEGKVRKHISRMKGVTSFNIDFAAKKVTVIGDVTPLGVLASVSKVKSAQLWTPAMSSSAPIGGSSYAEVKKQHKGVGA
ncbi:protein SODIUM POTASSIUM ROOT DEFECTIVE 2-like [Cornus florida]|uniref:protein SODIUM POTASSIUM ROOT DEFECTIVE 2-like n=1 Tax=Cornus florida TaxID=4283 RepID=UPI0028976FC3|nr:protein SODIUM POTASSIUM ROOT DEFECTIVE 2-like [Cornus florida]